MTSADQVEDEFIPLKSMIFFQPLTISNVNRGIMILEDNQLKHNISLNVLDSNIT